MSRHRDRGQGTLVKRADGRWQGQIRHTDPSTGERLRLTVYGRTKTAARDKMRAAAARLAAGAPALDSAMSLADYATAWQTGPLAASDRAPSTRDWYAVQIRQHIVPALGAKRLNALRRSDIERMVGQLREQGLAPSTVRGVLTCLKAILSSAVADGLLAASPAATVARPRLDSRSATALRAEQAAALLDAAPDRLRPLLVVALSTGLRRGELLALHWADVDLDAKVIVVRRSMTTARTLGPTKTRAERVVALADPAVAALREQRASVARERLAVGSAYRPSDLVFPSQIGTPSDPRNTSRAVTKAAQRAGLAGVSLHSLRHTHASHALSSGVPLSVVSKTLGHSSVAITADVYGHIVGDERAQAAQAVAASLGLGS